MLTLILKPLMFAAVDVQHHPWQRTTLTPLAVHPALGLALHQAGRLQRLLDPRVAQPDLVFFTKLLHESAARSDRSTCPGTGFRTCSACFVGTRLLLGFPPSPVQ